MSDCDCEVEIASREQGRVLWILLSINATMFVAEMTAGILSESTGLIADSLDMLADATVYGIGLYAVGRAAHAKIRAASLSGMFQVLLALGVAFEVARRLLFGSEPEALFMIAASLVALLANVVCLAFIAKHKDGEVHMRASWIFSKNDVIANVGVIVAGALVHFLASPLPDLAIGAMISFVVLRGGLAIIADARAEKTRTVA